MAEKLLEKNKMDIIIIVKHLLCATKKVHNKKIKVWRCLSVNYYMYSMVMRVVHAVIVLNINIL